MPEVLPDPSDQLGKLLARITELERQVKSMRSSNPLENGTVRRGGLHFTDGGGITIDGGGGITIGDDGTIASDDFDGTGPADPGTTGWWLGGGASGAVLNTLFLRDGIVPDDALANPVTAGIGDAVTTNSWGTGTSQATVASTTIAVPAGFSRALVMAVGGVIFRTGAPNDFWSRILINADTGDELMNIANAVGSTPVSHSAILTGLSGGSITLAVQVRSLFAEAPATGRYAQISGSAVFFR